MPDLLPTLEAAHRDTERAVPSEPREIVLARGPVAAPEFGQRYAREGTLGEGGMGSVLLCADKQIGRTVALKIIRADQAGSGRIEQRFLREARVQGQLEHPAVVPVYDLGVDPAGAVYFTMKRVRGDTLEELLEAAPGEARFTRHQLLAALARVCLAIDFAHRRGVLHRDLKPANLMLGDYGEVYVLDWGLAKLRGHADLDEEGAQTERVAVDTSAETAAGAILGTPGYMPPEQLRGADELTPAADVYALGAILFEILTRAPLHPRASMAAIVASTLDGVEARPSVRAPEAAVAPELEAICVRATALDPKERYPNARALHDALERYLAGERDLEARRQIAERHAERAEQAATRVLAGEGGLEDRRTAMREIGRTLALDPENQAALGSMMRLLTTAPTGLPPEVRAELKLSTYEQNRATGRLGALAYASVLLYLPLFLWIGVRELLPVVLLFVSAALTTAISVWVVRHRRPPTGGVVAAMVMSNVTFAAVATFYGPMILLPPILVANTIAFAIHLDGWRRWLSVALGCTVVLVPTLLEALGLIAPSTTFADGTMVLHPRALELRPVPTTVFLTLVSVAAIVTGSTVVGGVRNALREAEERLYVYAWHLREIVPESVRPATDPTRARR